MSIMFQILNEFTANSDFITTIFSILIQMEMVHNLLPSLHKQVNEIYTL